MPFIHQTSPDKIKRTGEKYLLSPDGSLYEVSEHSYGAKHLAEAVLKMADLENIGIDPDRIPPTFGLTEIFKLGWLRLNTYDHIVGVTWGTKSHVDLTKAQRHTLEELRDRFNRINGDSNSKVLAGDGPSADDREDLLPSSSDS